MKGYILKISTKVVTIKDWIMIRLVETEIFENLGWLMINRSDFVIRLL